MNKYLSLRSLFLGLSILCLGIGLSACFFTKPLKHDIPLYTEEGKNRFALSIEDSEGNNLLSDSAFVSRLSVSWQYYSTAWASTKLSHDKSRYEIGASIPVIERERRLTKGERFETTQSLGFFKEKPSLEFITAYVYHGDSKAALSGALVTLHTVEVAGQTFAVPQNGDMLTIPLVYAQGQFHLKGGNRPNTN